MAFELRSIPIVCKALLAINVILFVLEVVLYPLNVDLVDNFCLNPSKIISEFETGSFTIYGVSSLLMSNLFHLNPWTAGPMGIMHIGMNMTTLLSEGKYLEQQFGSLTFLCFTLLFLFVVGPLSIPIAMCLEAMTMKSVALLSTDQCGVGFSAVLFAYFVVYLHISPNEMATVFGVRMKKWMVPFVQLVLLSVLLRASFIGHLSGIVAGLIYISGVPGCFMQRQNCIKNIEKRLFLECITKRSDYISAPSLPKINGFKPRSSCFNNNRSALSVSDSSDDEIDESYDEEEVDGLMVL